MNILFIGTCGVYHPLIAGHMHLNKLSNDDYHNLQFFADHKNEASGQPLYLGTDLQDNKVYTLGVGPDVNMVKKSIEDLRLILGVSADELQIVPIIIKSQLLLLILHKISAVKPLKYLLLPWINFILVKQIAHIKKQLDSGLGNS